MPAENGDEGPAKGPVPPEPGREAGPHNAPSPDPREPTANRTPLEPEPGDGAPRVIAEDPPASEGDTVHLEDDRVR